VDLSRYSNFTWLQDNVTIRFSWFFWTRFLYFWKHHSSYATLKQLGDHGTRKLYKSIKIMMHLVRPVFNKDHWSSRRVSLKDRQLNYDEYVFLKKIINEFFNIFKKYFIITFYMYLISVALSNFYFISGVFFIE